MLEQAKEISPGEHALVGAVQERAVVLAEEYEVGSTETRRAIIARFGGTKYDPTTDTRIPTGKLDLNGAMFLLNRNTAIHELDQFIAGLAVEDLDTKMARARELVDAKQGVVEEAASAGAIIKALVLTGDRDTKEALIGASLRMQLSVRTLKIAEGFTKAQYDRDAAKELLFKSDKLDYVRDTDGLVDANHALIYICNTAMTTATELERALKRDEHDPDGLTPAANAAFEMQRSTYEMGVKLNVKKCIDAMKEAVAMYKSIGRTELAQKAEEVHTYFTQHYGAIMEMPRVMTSPAEWAKEQGPQADDTIN
jgi:hypothetical protein